MYRITSANGTTSVANEDIMTVMRTFTTESAEGFRVKSLYLECATDTTIKVNGENATFLKIDSATDKYFIDLGKYDVIVKTLTITTSGTVWRATFLY